MRPSFKKRFGQHHLRDGALCRPLVDYLRPADQRVLEIGAGGGVLTERLVRAGARVVACEVDLDWAFHLRRRWAAEEVRTVAVDALHLDWHRLPSPTLLAGNLPFNVATRLIEEILPHAETIPRAAFMVQREVAERLVAGPGEAAYGSLSVLVAAQASARLLGTVRPGSFHPPPKVAAAFVGFELRPPPLPAEQMPAFIRLVRQAFALRRKTLRNSLAASMGRPAAEALLAGAGIDPRRRAETLGLAELLGMFEVWQRL